jgi:BlaI family penicillinase repressor
MSKSPPRIGKVQYQIMQTLWQHGRATAREITDELAQSQAIAHSTVQTLLRQLEAKGFVGHEIEERTFVFRALCQQSQVTETPLHDILTRVYKGSVVNLMSHLLKHENISPEELARLRSMLDEDQEK